MEDITHRPAVGISESRSITKRDPSYQRATEAAIRRFVVLVRIHVRTRSASLLLPNTPAHSTLNGGQGRLDTTPVIRYRSIS